MTTEDVLRQQIEALQKLVEIQKAVIQALEAQAKTAPAAPIPQIPLQPLQPYLQPYQLPVPNLDPWPGYPLYPSLWYQTSASPSAVSTQILV